jgi:hypothetical protein
LHLDLVGLPPDVDQIDAFLDDRSPLAYERVVDRLLASPHFGEKWTRRWLDLARYADSNGYQADQLREIWPYRDWVVRAINEDMPFDGFTIEQIAGDLIPGATVDQRVATGFHRSVTCNVEAGVDPEENRVAQVFDRVNTTGAVWLGSTLECAQCHNHKYDPLSQREYYGLFAFFNNTPLEVALADGRVRYDQIGPKLELPLPEDDRRECERIETRRTELKKILADAAAGKQGAVEEGIVEEKIVEEEIAGLETRLGELSPPTTLVMVEMETPRPTHVLIRGDFLRPGPKVEPSTPDHLHPMPEGSPANRLGLAHWLVDSRNPLTARVTVNRWWSELFGQGLVRTPEDFGLQGERPTHPELLDWLAVDVMRRGWSRKSLLRLLVTSATYRQSARVTVELADRDPGNELLARGPRHRLAAEEIRDHLLAVAGLLSRRLGGPPVFPPQPQGIWRHTGRNAPEYTVSENEDRFRRGLYVVWRRAAPYPSFILFDAPERTSCVVRRRPTNTPLQALVLMNDQAYVECAMGFAWRLDHEMPSSTTTAERIEYGWRLCTGRRPQQQEMELLEQVYQRELKRYRGDPAAARALWDGFTQRNVSLPAGDLSSWAAWFHVASVLLNLDETITKE